MSLHELPNEQPSLPPRLVLAIGVLSVGVSAILVRMTDDVPARSIAFYRLFITTLILAPLAFQREREAFRALTRRDLIVCGGIGVVLAVHFASWIESLFWTSVASSVIIVSLECILAAVGAVVFLRERLSPKGWAGIAAAFLGVALLAAGDRNALHVPSGGTPPTLPFLGQIPDASVALFGDALAFLGAVMAAIYLVAGRHIRQRMPLLVYVTLVYGACSLTLLAYAMATHAPLTGFAAKDWTLLVAMAIIPTIGGHTAFNWVLRWLPATTVSTAILGEPLIAALLAGLLFSEIPPALGIAGGIVTLLGILLVVRAEAHPDPSATADVEGVAIVGHDDDPRDRS